MTATEQRPRTLAGAWKSPAATYYLLAASSTILLLVGLAVVLSSSSIYSIRSSDGNPYTLFIIQLAAFAVGLAAMIVGSRMPVRLWKRAAPWVLFVSMGLLVLVMTSGVSSGGNQNWIRLGPVSAQPSEIAKLGLALYLGVVLAKFRRHLTSFKRIFVPGGIMAMVVIGLVLAGRDMGTAIILSILVAAAFWVAGLPARFFGVFAVLGAGAIALLVTVQQSRFDRIMQWLSSTCDNQDACWQSQHGTYALASGGLWGLGPGMSREKWGYLPAADNDFIYAVLGEEFGLLGTLLVLFAFAMMVVAINRIVHRNKDPFVQIAGAAIGAWIVCQACINIAVVVGLAPVTGVPLPLVSSGGSSLIMSMAAVGVLMAFARAEPGAAEAFAARPSAVRRSLAVLSRGRRG